MAVLLDLSLLRTHPDYRRLWLGLSIANLGSQLTVVAVGLQVYAITRSTLSVGILGLCALVPLVILGLYGGALVDAYDRRRVALIASTGVWLVTLGLATQAWLHVHSVLLLYVLVAAQSAGFAINNPARTAIVPRLVEPRRLPQANVLSTVSFNVAFTGGPVLGALLVAAWGYQAAYTIDALLFTASLWALWRLPALPAVVADDAPAAPLGRRGRMLAPLRSVVEGLRYLGTRPNVRMTFVVDLIAMIFAMPRVVLPAVGVLYIGGGATTTGLLSTAIALGGILAGVFSGGLVRVRRQARVIVGSIVGFGLGVVGFGVVLLATGAHSPPRTLLVPLLLGMLFLAVAGGSDAISAVFRQTILQAATPDQMRGRLQGVFIVVVAGGPRLGDLVVGSEAQWWGEGTAVLVGGLTCIALLLLVVSLQGRRPGASRFLDYDADNPRP